VKWDKYHIDILTANFVLHPDCGSTSWSARTCSATFSLISAQPAPAPSASRRRAISTRKAFPVGVRPVHGSAQISQGGIANDRHDLVGPMMLEHLGEKQAAASIVGAIERTLGERTLRTRDLGGNAIRQPAARPSLTWWR